MPSARSQFSGIRRGLFWLHLPDGSTGSVHRNPAVFNSTAEVTAEVALLLAMQRVKEYAKYRLGNDALV
jgi:hypothetical protein